MAKIIELHKHTFPPGAIAYHPTYRSCKILKEEGLQRKVRYGIMDGQKLVFKTTVVPTRELRVNQH